MKLGSLCLKHQIQFLLFQVVKEPIIVAHTCVLLTIFFWFEQECFKLTLIQAWKTYHEKEMFDQGLSQ